MLCRLPLATRFHDWVSPWHLLLLNCIASLCVHGIYPRDIAADGCHDVQLACLIRRMGDGSQHKPSTNSAHRGYRKSCCALTTSWRFVNCSAYSLYVCQLLKCCGNVSLYKNPVPVSWSLRLTTLLIGFGYHTVHVVSFSYVNRFLSILSCVWG